MGDLGRFRPLTVSFTDGNNYSYLPPNNVQLIEPKEKIIERYMQGESETERKLVKYLIDKAKRNCPNLVSAESLKKTKIGDKVLIFSDLNFQLLVASVIKVRYNYITIFYNAQVLTIIKVKKRNETLIIYAEQVF